MAMTNVKLSIGHGRNCELSVASDRLALCSLVVSLSLSRRSIEPRSRITFQTALLFLHHGLQFCDIVHFGICVRIDNRFLELSVLTILHGVISQ